MRITTLFALSLLLFASCGGSDDATTQTASSPLTAEQAAAASECLEAIEACRIDGVGCDDITDCFVECTGIDQVCAEGDVSPQLCDELRVRCGEDPCAGFEERCANASAEDQVLCEDLEFRCFPCEGAEKVCAAGNDEALCKELSFACDPCLFLDEICAGPDTELCAGIAERCP